MAVRVVNTAEVSKYGIRVVNTAEVSKYGDTRSKYGRS